MKLCVSTSLAYIQRFSCHRGTA